MNKDEYFQFITDLHEQMLELVRAKNADYTAGGGPFANFKASAEYGVDPMVGLSIRVGDKIKRLQSFCKLGNLEVRGEGVEDIFKDLIGYSWIALGMLHEAKQAEEASQGERGEAKGSQQKAEDAGDNPPKEGKSAPGSAKEVYRLARPYR